MARSPERTNATATKSRREVASPRASMILPNNNAERAKTHWWSVLSNCCLIWDATWPRTVCCELWAESSWACRAASSSFALLSAFSELSACTPSVALASMSLAASSSSVCTWASSLFASFFMSTPSSFSASLLGWPPVPGTKPLVPRAVAPPAPARLLMAAPVASSLSLLSPASTFFECPSLVVESSPLASPTSTSLPTTLTSALFSALFSSLPTALTFALSPNISSSSLFLSTSPTHA
mmetsp:Transcript_56937/g.165287  ORF Transcript_56937/g.165287 Transcript_56937/m.165287 type:complete len:239 (-) Transcript_56937:739-1455(-)